MRAKQKIYRLVSSVLLSFGFEVHRTRSTERYKGRFMRKRAYRSKAIKNYLSSHQVRKLQIGAGPNILEGWLNTDECQTSRGVVYLDATKPFWFEDGTFDTITVAAVLEHIFDPYHLAKECHRLLRGGGSLIVQVPNIAWLPYRIRSLMGKVPEPPHCEDAEWDYAHLHSFTRQSLKKLLEREGFEVVKVTCGGILAGPRRIYGSLLGADIAMVGVKKT